MSYNKSQEEYLGSCETHEEEDDDHSEYDNDDNDDDEEEDDGLLSYLFDKSFIKQHALAVLFAILATAMSYSHMDTIVASAIPPAFTNSNDNDQTSPNSSTSFVPITPKSRSRPLNPTQIHHHHSYRRTEHLAFCATDYFSPSESHEERIRRALQITNEDDVDPNLQLFQFNFPKKYIDILKLYYHADDMNMDEYISTSSSGDSQNPHYACLLESSVLNDKKSTVPMHTIGFIHPNVETYNQQDGDDTKNNKHKYNRQNLNEGLAVLKQHKKNSNNKKEMKPADLSYKGFTAKFTNLSTKEINLYWDSRTKAKFVSSIPPFQSVTTVTFPGNSFHVTPNYDITHALQRWTITSDEAVLYYDPHDGGKDEAELASKLSEDELWRYNVHQLNRLYGREYLAVTRRAWLATFPKPMHMHHMWDATYFGQVHVVKTKQTHFIASGTHHQSEGEGGGQELWKSLDYEDYDLMVEGEKNGKKNASVQFPQYREKGELELTLKVISAAPRVFEIDDFLSPSEVEHLLSLGKQYNVTATDHKQSLKSDPTLTKDEKKKRKKALSIAQSNAWVRRDISPIVNSIYHRAADVLQIDESLLRHRNEFEHSELNTHHSIAEALHLTQYVETQGYSARLDGSQPSITNRYQPNRFATIVFFLNDGNEMEGGELNFPLAVTSSNHDGVTVKPKVGKAVVFYNMLPDGNLDDLCHHNSKVIEKGEKWMGTLYVWDPIID